MILKWSNIILIIIIFAMAGYIMKKEFETIPIPFRCHGVTEYNIGDDNHELMFNVNQDLRLEAHTRSVFLVRGDVLSGKEKYNLNRMFELSGFQAIDKDTVILKIDRIIKSETDSTPDALFNIYRDEIIVEPKTLQLDIVHFQKGTWLIGNPIQFLYTCTRY